MLTTFQVQDKKKKQISKAKVIKHSFSGGYITKYSGMNVIAGFLNRSNIIASFSKLFPTTFYNATKFSNVQILLYRFSSIMTFYA